jgi:hypothetical protein
MRHYVDQLRAVSKRGWACRLVTKVGEFAKKVDLVFGNGDDVDLPFWS